MSGAAILSVVAIVISGLSVIISLYVGSRQIAQFGRANHFPVVAGMLAEFRNAEFHVKYDYVVNKLKLEHPPKAGLGIMNLPEPARSNVIDIAFYFQEFASLRRFKILDESENLGNLYRRTAEVWNAISPYVEQERESSKDKANEDTLKILQGFAEERS